MCLVSVGGFYSDAVGHVAESCKRCPTGSFVSFDAAPGTQKQDCKSCPEGKNETRSHNWFYSSDVLYFYCKHYEC